LKINSINNSSLSSKKKSNKKVKNVNNHSFKTTFSNSILEEVSQVDVVSIEQIDELFTQLDKYEENLAQLPNDYNFLKYKKHLQQMTTLISKSNYILKKIEFRSKKNIAQLEVVYVINKKLAEIFSSITQRNIETLKVLHLMGEIKGLLLENIRA